jgi:hypothetical protein
MITQKQTKMAIHRCNKEDKIGAMEQSIENLNRVVLEGTNGDSLLSMARQTKKSAESIGKNVKQLLTFQTVVETEREIKREIREKQNRRMQWAIGLLIGTILSLITILITVLKNTG